MMQQLGQTNPTKYKADRIEFKLVYSNALSQQANSLQSYLGHASLCSGYHSTSDWLPMFDALPMLDSNC